MLEAVLDWLRAKRDPLRGEYSAARWAATVSSRETADIQRRVVEIVGSFPLKRKRVLPEHFDALLKVDERVDAVVDELEADFIAGHGASADEETRLWRSVFELTRVLLAAYQHSLKSASRSAEREWSTRLPLLLARAAHYKLLDARLRLYRYARWSSAQWREMHQVYELARVRRWHHRRLAFGEGDDARELPSVEEMYIRTLLEQRMDSGNFTPDQVAWVSERMQGWAEGMRLDSRRTDKSWFFVDPAGSSGLRRLSGSTPMSRVRYLAPGQVLQRIEQRLVELEGVAETVAENGELPPVEQRLVLRRLHGLYASESEPRSRRAAREEVEQPIRVLLGLEAIARALAMQAGPSALHTVPGAQAMHGASAAQPATAVPGVPAAPGSSGVWRVADRSRTGFRLLAPDFSPARIGQLVGLDVDGGWQVGVVRRMVRLESDEITYGVEILSRRPVAVEVRAAEDGAVAYDSNSMPAVYLPASSENRDPALKSILVSDALARPGALMGLEHGSTRYLVRLGLVLEGYASWALATIESAREA